MRLNIVTPTQTSSTTASIYEFLIFGPVTGSSPDFAVTADPGTQSTTAGYPASYTSTVVSLNGFSGTVALSASGLPAGAAASFSPASVNAFGDSALTISTSTSTPAGTYTVAITGTSNGVQHSTSVTFTVTSWTGQVQLGSVSNKLAMVTDGSVFTGGLDGTYAYSANLLGSSVTYQSTLFNLGQPNVLDAVSSITVPLPASNCSTLAMLATGVNGSQTSQTFTVTYTDNSTTSITQSLSDWHTPQNFPGESQAVVMAYRDAYNGTRTTEASTFTAIRSPSIRPRR